MIQKWWFKLFVWICSSAFFFAAAAITISFFNPGPNESSVMNFMTGMMSAMHGSTMGYSATIEGDSVIEVIIFVTSKVTLPLIIIAILGAIFLKLRRQSHE